MRRMKTISAAFPAAAATFHVHAEDAEKPRTNVILALADDLGWGQVSYNGHPHLKTPNLDAMAANGLRFETFYAAGSVCSPTRASFLTGRHPH